MRRFITGHLLEERRGLTAAAFDFSGLWHVEHSGRLSLARRLYPEQQEQPCSLHVRPKALRELADGFAGQHNLVDIVPLCHGHHPPLRIVHPEPAHPETYPRIARQI